MRVCYDKYTALTCRDRFWLLVGKTHAEPLLDQLVAEGFMRSSTRKQGADTVLTYRVTPKGKRWVEADRKRAGTIAVHAAKMVGIRDDVEQVVKVAG